MNTVTDTLLTMIRRDGYHTGTGNVATPDGIVAYVEAGKGGQRWRVLGRDRYSAVVELMEQLGWDLSDGEMETD